MVEIEEEPYALQMDRDDIEISEVNDCETHTWYEIYQIRFREKEAEELKQQILQDRQIVKKIREGNKHWQLDEIEEILND